MRDATRTRLWPFPTLAVLVAVVLGFVLPLVDAEVDDSIPVALRGLPFSGGPDAARTMLSSVSGSLITVTSLTFSLTVVSSCYSPSCWSRWYWFCAARSWPCCVGRWAAR